MGKDKKNKADCAQDKQEDIATKKTSDEKVEERAVCKKEESCNEQLLRINADFQNFKRRVEKERIEWMVLAQSKTLESLLPLFDELDRALDLADQKADKQVAAWLDGFKLIQKNWKKRFKELGVKEIEGSGKFDPELHEALVQVDSEDIASGDIVQCFEKGYTFKEKVIKHAKVSVAK